MIQERERERESPKKGGGGENLLAYLKQRLFNCFIKLMERPYFSLSNRYNQLLDGKSNPLL
jgi:hypothetical protein